MAKTKKLETASKATSKEDALQRVIAQIEKQYGQGAIMQMDEHKYAKIEGISTGSLKLKAFPQGLFRWILPWAE